MFCYAGGSKTKAPAVYVPCGSQTTRLTMEIKPETIKKVAYPALAAVVAATALSSCQQQQQQEMEILSGVPPCVAPAKK